MIKFIVPFGAVSGPISVPVGDRIGVSPRFTVTESSDTLRFTVTRYDITPPITEKDSSVVDRMGFLRTWSADVHGDTIHLYRTYRPGDDLCEHHFLLVHTGANQLPRLFMAWTTRTSDVPGTSVDTIRTGILKIQDWDTSGLMSGKFFGRPSVRDMLNGTVTFWIKKEH
jgi:hypothetical protein